MKMDVDDKEIIYYWQRIRGGSMEILIIGNGFDLEHDLPTTYHNFLDFCEKIICLSIDDKEFFKDFCEILQSKWDFNKQIKEHIISVYEKSYDTNVIEEDRKKDKLFELFECIRNNVWLQYFLKRLEKKKNIGENWIDFEMEISKVIQFLDRLRIELPKTDREKRFAVFNLELMKSDILPIIWSIEKIKKGRVSIETAEDIDRVVSVLDSELERFIRAFEIYIDEIVNKLPITKKSKDIEKINPDFVLSFNYSNTYERVYGEGKDIQYDYIHGKADANKNIKTCNLVLGIDEYLEDDRKDTDLEFIAFKKYFQRIYKSTGNTYLECVDKIKKDYEEYVRKTNIENMSVPGMIMSTVLSRIQCFEHTLYIFGHSLDITDRDILRLFICNDNVQTKIFYHQKDEDDKTMLGKLIKNLVRIMGQDELIRRTGGEHKTIEFIPQSKHEE